MIYRYGFHCINFCFSIARFFLEVRLSFATFNIVARDYNLDLLHSFFYKNSKVEVLAGCS